MILAAIATLLGAAVQSATGFGFVLILGPAMFAVLDPGAALTTLLCLATGLNLLVLFSERRPRQVRRHDLAVVLLAAVPGLVAGALILERISKPALQVVVGVAILAAVALQQRAAGRPAPRATAERPRTATVLTGLATGVLTTTTGTNGPPLVIWLQRAAATPAQIRDTLAAGFLALSAAGAIVLALTLDEPQQLELDIVVPLLGLVLAGQVLGRLAFERLDHTRFRQAGLALVLVAGVASIVAGVEAT
jgi:uncharacterized membrane protein YfcA